MAHRWHSLSRRWKAMGVATGLLLLALVPIQMATGQTTPTPVPFDAGNLKLHMNTDASAWKYFDAGGTLVQTDTFSASAKCAYVPGTNGDPLMAPSASSSTSGTVVGYLTKDNGYGLGVNKGGKEGTGSCTQTNIPEKLTLELQNDPATSSVHGLYVDSTALDMEFKYNATLTAAFFLNGSPVGTDTYRCTNSDCGPDSGGGDNYVVNLRAPVHAGNPNRLWDKVEFTVSSTNSQGAVTLEGGNDPGTSESNFHLVDLLSPVDCGQTISGEDGETHVDVVLVASGDCTAKGYDLNVDPRSIELITAGGTTEQWVVDVNDWSPETAVNPVPATTVFPPVGGETAVWCNGTYNGDDDPATGGTLGASMPSGHSWCLIRQDSEIAGDGLMQVNETFLLEADAKLQR